jgi:non-heme chloroperoxidase
VPPLRGREHRTGLVVVRRDVDHHPDDQVVPYASSGPRAVKLVRNGTLKTYPGFPHGMLTTHADTINDDLLTFIQS